MVEGVKKFRLEFESESLRESGVFCNREVKVDEVRPVEPRMPTKYSRGRIGSDGSICRAQGLEDLRVDDIDKGGTDVVNANRILQLRHGDAVEDDSAVAIIVERTESPEQL